MRFFFLMKITLECNIKKQKNYKKGIPYLSGIFSKLCSNKKKKSLVSKHTLVQISIYPWLTGRFHTKVKKCFLKFNAKIRGQTDYFVPLNFSKWRGQLPLALSPMK